MTIPDEKSYNRGFKPYRFKGVEEFEDEKNLEYISEFGRYDDLLSLFGTKCEKAMLKIIEAQLKQDIAALENGGEISQLAKWLPSVNASNAETVKQAKAIAKYMGMSDAEYRKTLVSLRSRIRIIENNLREKDYSFDYPC